MIQDKRARIPHTWEAGGTEVAAGEGEREAAVTTEGRVVAEMVGVETELADREAALIGTPRHIHGATSMPLRDALVPG